jgi:NhaP-type Na+/H+ or K+/H+ antiporter
LQAYSAANNVTETSMITILWDFAYLFVASLALGMTFGLGIAFTLKLLRSRDSPQVRQQHVAAGLHRVVELFASCDEGAASCGQACLHHPDDCTASS